MGYFYDGVSTLFFYDDNDATGGHTAGQPHSLAEGVLSPAWSPFLTAAAGVYRSDKAIRAGDNIAGHVNTTTFLSNSGESLYFTSGALTTGAPNAAGVRWRLGIKVGSGEGAFGTAGLFVVGAGNCSLQGDILMFGCAVRASAWSLLPFDSGVAQSEASGNLFVLSTSSAIGSVGVRNLTEFQNNTIINISGSIQIIGTVFVTNASGNRLVHGLANTYGINTTPSQMKIVRVSFFGVGPAVAEIAAAAGVPANWFIAEPTWNPVAEYRHYYFVYSANQLANGLQHFEFAPLHTEVCDIAGHAVAGIPVKLTDTVTGQVQADTLTDALGDISFGSSFVVGQPLTPNRVIVADVGNWEFPANTDYSWRYRGPFLIEFNTGPGRNMAYPVKRLLFDWPYSGSARRAGQLRPVVVPVNLGSPGGTPPDWEECVAA